MKIAPGYAPPGSAPVFDQWSSDRRLARSQAARTQGFSEEAEMKKALVITTTAMLFAALGLLSRGGVASSEAAQETITGDWTASVKQTDRGPVLWLSLNRNRDAGRGYFQMSSDFPLQDFTGLNPNANSNVRFTLQREAGVVLFDGLFKDGRGVGDFRFTPNSGFISTMRNLGYEELTTEKLFSMTIHDVSSSFINELKSFGYDKIPVNKLIAMRIHGVSGDFIRRMQAIGYKDIPSDKLIAMRIHGVDEKFIREAEAMGYKDLPVNDLIAMRIHNIDEEYVKSVQAMGYKDIPFNKLVSMRIHNVNGKFIKEMEEVGYNNIPLNKLITMRIHSIDSKFVKEMKDQGFNNLSIDDLIKLRIHGVDSDYIKRMRGSR